MTSNLIPQKLLTIDEAHARAKRLGEIQWSEESECVALRWPGAVKSASDQTLATLARQVPTAIVSKVVQHSNAPAMSAVTLAQWHNAVTLRVTMSGIAHGWSRSVSVPLSMTLGDLHDRVLSPVFGVPRRPGTPFFFSPPVTATSHAACVKESKAFYAAAKALDSAPLFYFPTVFGASLSHADLALFGVTQLYDATKTPLAHVASSPGAQFVWCFLPSDAGFFFTVDVVDVRARGLQRDAVVELNDSGCKGGALLLPAPASFRTVLQRHAKRLYPAARLHARAVGSLQAGGTLDVSVGDSWYTGAQLESPDVVLHALLMPCNVRFFRRQLMLHAMLSYSCVDNATLVRAQPSEPGPPRLPVLDAVDGKCVQCSAPLAPAKRLVCGNCRIVAYCDSACQALHWEEHRPFCCRLVDTAAQLSGADIDGARVQDFSIAKLRYRVKVGTNESFWTHREALTAIEKPPI